MDNRSAIIRLFLSGTICVAMLLYSGYDTLFNSQAVLALLDNSAEYQSVIEPLSEEESTDTVTSESTNTQPPETSSSTESASEEIEVKASGTVLGSVTEKFITPYTANTSYGGVYLKNGTDLDIDIKSLLSENLPYKIEQSDSVQVLIMHTHTTESFLSADRDYYTDTDLSRTVDNNMNTARLGAVIAEKLNNAGIKTVHDKTQHDHPEYNGSYDRAAKTIKSYLKKYPDIKVVIDLHRDAISGDGSDKVKPVVEINGKKAAQVMLVMGSQSGTVKNHPNWKENLKLAVRFQQQLESNYPTLARAINFMPRLYNQNLTKGSMLLEIGTEANSIQEVIYSAELVSDALIKTLKNIEG